MNLQIRNPKAYELARRIAVRRGMTLTDAVISTLEAEVARQEEKEPLADRIARIHERARRLGRPGGHRMTKDEIDDMWGHPPDPAQ